MLEAARNVACVGARPLALVNCLNFGNPEHPEVMWQFSEVVDGMSEACEALGIPVIGGNVSFYNESRGADIDPTPVVGVLGLIDELDAPRRPAPRSRAGDAHRRARRRPRPSSAGRSGPRRHGLAAACRRPPTSTRHAALHELVRRPRHAARSVAGVHDVSDGGLAVALAEMAIAGAVGVPGRRSAERSRAMLVLASRRRRVVPRRSPPAPTPRSRAAAAGRRAPPVGLGAAGGDRARGRGRLLDVALADATDAWRDALPPHSRRPSPGRSIDRDWRARGIGRLTSGCMG